MRRRGLDELRRQRAAPATANIVVKFDGVTDDFGGVDHGVAPCSNRACRAMVAARSIAGVFVVSSENKRPLPMSAIPPSSCSLMAETGSPKHIVTSFWE